MGLDDGWQQRFAQTCCAARYGRGGLDRQDCLSSTQGRLSSLRMARRFNGWLWGGLLLTVVAFLSYFAFFTRFAVTRDVPWVSFLLFLLAVALLVVGWRRAPRKILPTIVVVLGLFVTGAFTYLVTIGSRQLPAATDAPSVGQKAPDFILRDTANREVKLSSLLAQSNGVVLIFYRGYW